MNAEDKMSRAFLIVMLAALVAGLITVGSIAWAFWNIARIVWGF